MRTILDPNLHNLVVLLSATKKSIRSLELKEKELITSIKLELGDLLEETKKFTIESTEFGAGVSYTIIISDGISITANTPIIKRHAKNH